MRARRLDIGAIGAACAALLVLAFWCAAAGAATFRVTTTADGFAPPGGACTLRAAIEAVDLPGQSTECGTARSGPNRIVLKAGHYHLSVHPRGGDGNATGDLNIRAPAALQIIGARRSATVIDAAGIGDRVLSVSGTASVTMSRLTIKGGRTRTPAPGPSGTNGAACLEGGNGGDGRSAGDGGGIYNTGTLTLKKVSVTGNTTGTGGAGGAGGAQDGAPGCPGGAGGRGGDGGGVFNLGRLDIVDSSIHGNVAGAGGAGGSGGGGSTSAGNGGQGGGGGGIYSLGALSVAGSAIFGNRAGEGGSGASAQGGGGAGGAGGPGGGIFSASGPLAVANSTLAGNVAGTGGNGGGLVGPGGAGGSGGAIRVEGGPSTVWSSTVARNGVGAGGASDRVPGAIGSGGGLSVESPLASYNMRLQNTIVASSIGSDCAADPSSAISDDGHNLSFGDSSCPGKTGNPRLGPLRRNGGPTETMSLGSASAAIGQVPRSGGHCPSADQRGVRRPQGRRCDIGAFEFARPTITIVSPRPHGSYERGSRLRVRFRCGEGGLAGLIVRCRASRRAGAMIGTRSVGSRRFTVTAVDRAGHRTIMTIRYSVWQYVNPLRAIRGLNRERIDMGVDYGGSGPVLALGAGRVLGARNDDSGASGCLSDFCWPGGGIVVYRLTDGPFAGRYVYVTENVTVTVRPGQTVRAGQEIAVLHPSQPDMETGWGSSRIGRPLALIRGDQCPCGDPGGWSSIEGRNFNRLLVALGAPSGRLQPNPPAQSMPRGWPSWP
jgi:CSLREA domain-containing protein